MGEWEVDIESAGLRLDVFLARSLAVSRAEAQRWLESGGFRLNNQPARPSARLRAGDRVTGSPPEREPTRLEPENLPIEVVYQDEDVLVVNKPRGLVVHPAPGHSSGTLVNAVLGKLSDAEESGGSLRPGIVHRLDKDTTGLLVVARSHAAYTSLHHQITARRIRRVYLGLVWGEPSFHTATIDAPIGRHPVDRKRMAVLTDPTLRSRSAVTEAEVLEQLGPMSLLRLELHTGRTHQIRVHCAYVGHPVVGDEVYGGRRNLPKQGVPTSLARLLEPALANLGGQALHAAELEFSHPTTGVVLSFCVPPPEDFAALLNALRKNGSLRDAHTAS